jgi:molybdate transport repressor ModE-like protein
MVLSARMPELGALEVLLAVARAGSLNAAAEEIGVTQQAVSARVASLESLTGVQLITRTTRGSTLTSAGVVAAEWADHLLRLAGEVDAGLSALRHDQRTRLRVSASLTIAEQLLPGWLVSMQVAGRHGGPPPPDVVLVATNSDSVIERVRNADADLGFIEGPLVPRGVRSKIIGHDELQLVVRPDHAWARRTRPITIAELVASALVSREPGSGTRDFLTAALVAAAGPDAVAATPALELSTAASVRAAVLAGAGPAVLSNLAVADDLASRRLRRVLVAGLDLHRSLRAIWLGGRIPPAGAARDLLGHIASRS